MQKKHIKAGRRTAICAVSAALLFSSMNLEIFATEANDLPSAGVDFFLSASATSVKSLKEDEDSTDFAVAAASKESSKSALTATAAATATIPPERAGCAGRGRKGNRRDDGSFYYQDYEPEGKRVREQERGRRI